MPGFSRQIPPYSLLVQRKAAGSNEPHVQLFSRPRVFIQKQRRLSFPSSGGISKSWVALEFHLDDSGRRHWQASAGTRTAAQEEREKDRSVLLQVTIENKLASPIGPCFDIPGNLSASKKKGEVKSSTTLHNKNGTHTIL